MASLKMASTRPEKNRKLFRNIPESQDLLNLAVIFPRENNDRSVKKTIVPDQAAIVENEKYHCVKMPQAKGMSKRRNGASFQTGTGLDCIVQELRRESLQRNVANTIGFSTR